MWKVGFSTCIFKNIVTEQSFLYMPLQWEERVFWSKKKLEIFYTSSPLVITKEP